MELEKKIQKSPCYKCENQGCGAYHDSCEAFIAWNTERKKRMEKDKGDRMMSAYHTEHDIRWCRRHRHIL